MIDEDVGKIKLSLVRIEEKLITVCDNITEIKEELRPLMEPNGVCDRSRSFLATVSTKVNNNSRIIYVLLGAVIGISFFVIRQFVLKG